ncbi:hypothetical protein, partial [Heyndrickxia coagulans]|uniref:hypothetical protein n=1 Tax=Heyndrickxia coagulans TaxID=1398 RepID=UPI0005522469
MPETMKMSFIGQMKDKTRAPNRENVLHWVNEGQNACHQVKSRLLCKFMGKCFQPPLHFFGLTSMDF